MHYLFIYKKFLINSFKIGSYYGILYGIISSYTEIKFSNSNNNYNSLNNSLIYLKNIVINYIYYGITVAGLILFSPTIIIGSIIYSNLINKLKK